MSGKQPGAEEVARGGYNPTPARTSEPKEQFGPLPTDAARDDKKEKKQSGKRPPLVEDKSKPKAE